MSKPDLSDDEINAILSELEDYQLTHGSLLKIPRGFAKDIDSPIAIARPIGISVIPTAFPRAQFQHAVRIQGAFNELYAKVAEDHAWLEGILEELRRKTTADGFVAKLWGIWERVVREDGGEEVQPWRCAVWRSDYMLQASREILDFQNRADGGNKGGEGDVRNVFRDAQLKQVEFNTFSCAGGSHATIVANAHRYLASRGAHGAGRITREKLRSNDSLDSIVRLLEAAYRAYGSPVSDDVKQTAILMTVQGRNINICDERPVEYALSECDPPILLYRVEFGEKTMQSCKLGANRELLFLPPSGGPPLEISVVYHRAGYSEGEYDDKGIEARYMLECSRAIKCPTILSQISGFKKVQQELARPGVLERFLTPDKSALLRQVFMPMYPLDDSPEGQHAREIALSEDMAADYILKPNMEGGGNNIHGCNIPDFLLALPPERWSDYILMRRIEPPLVHGVLVSPKFGYQGPTISELGILGTCMWARNDLGGGSLDIGIDSHGGWTFKTKPSHVEEMSVVMGYGCFDSPCLVDDE